MATGHQGGYSIAIYKDCETTGRQRQLASNIMGRLATKCGTTGRRFDSVNACSDAQY